MKNDNTFALKGFIVWGICALFFLYEFFLRIVIGTFQASIMRDLDLSFFQFSLLSTTLFLVTYGCMQIPIGFIVDRIGLKKSLFLGCIICSIGSFGFAYSYSYTLAIFFRIITGLGAAFGFICLLISVREWMPHKYNGVFIGLSQFIGTLGPMIAAGPLDMLAHTSDISWRFIFIILGSIGLLLAVLVWSVVENNRQTQGAYIVLRRPENIFISIKRTFSRLQPWYLALFAATSYFTIEYLSENEGRAFLMLKGLDFSWASFMLTTSWIGYAVGCPVLGYISDIVRRRKRVMVVGSFLGLIAAPFIVYSSDIYMLLVGFFLLGISASAQGIAFANVGEQVKSHFTALGYGLTNMVLTIFSGLNAPLIGFLLDTIKVHQSPTLQEYMQAFSVLIIVACIAFILVTFFITETYCKSDVDFTYIQSKKLQHGSE